MWACSLVNDATIGVKGVERGLDKLKGIFSMNNFGSSDILGDGFSDEVNKYENDLKAITKEVDPTDTSVIIDKYDIITMAQNRGSW